MTDDFDNALGEVRRDSILEKANQYGLRLNSGARSAGHNAAVGGAARSYHLTGNAGDFVGSRESMRAFHDDLKANHPDVAELIDENDHIHVAWHGASVGNAKTAKVAQASRPTPDEFDSAWESVKTKPSFTAGKVGDLSGQSVPVSGSTAGSTPRVTAVAPVVGVKRMPVRGIAQAGSAPVQTSQPVSLQPLNPIAQIADKVAIPTTAPPSPYRQRAAAIQSAPQVDWRAKTQAVQHPPLRVPHVSSVTGRAVPDVPVEPRQPETVEERRQRNLEIVRAEEDKKHNAVTNILRHTGADIVSGLAELPAGLYGAATRGLADLSGDTPASNAVRESGQQAVQNVADYRTQYGGRGVGSDIVHGGAAMVPQFALASLLPGSKALTAAGLPHDAVGFAVASASDAYGHGASVEDSIKAGLEAAAMMKLAGKLSEGITDTGLRGFLKRAAANTAAPPLARMAVGGAPVPTPEDLVFGGIFAGMHGGDPRVAEQQRTNEARRESGRQMREGEIPITAANPRLVRGRMPVKEGGNETKPEIRQTQEATGAQTVDSALRGVLQQQNPIIDNSSRQPAINAEGVGSDQANAIRANATNKVNQLQGERARITTGNRPVEAVGSGTEVSQLSVSGNPQEAQPLLPPPRVPPQAVALKPLSTTRFYRADRHEAQSAEGTHWVQGDPEYASQKYGKGEQGSESLWYIDVPNDMLANEYGDPQAVSITDTPTLERLGVKVEPQLYRRTGTAPQAVADALARLRKPQAMEEVAPVPATELPAQEASDWLKNNLDALTGGAEKSGLADKIEAAAARGLTAKQTAKELGTDADTVRAVRAKRGIPSQDEAAEFAAWRQSRAVKPPNSPIPPPASRKVVAPRDAVPADVLPPQRVESVPETPTARGVEPARTEPADVLPASPAEAKLGVGVVKVKGKSDLRPEDATSDDDIVTLYHSGTQVLDPDKSIGPSLGERHIHPDDAERWQKYNREEIEPYDYMPTAIWTAGQPETGYGPVIHKIKIRRGDIFKEREPGEWVVPEDKFSSADVEHFFDPNTDWDVQNTGNLPIWEHSQHKRQVKTVQSVPSPAPVKPTTSAWLQTQSDFIEQSRVGYQLARQEHESAVSKALAEGKPVPPEVLVDYPDLQAKAQAEPSAPIIKRGLSRNFRAGTNDATMTFASEHQRDLYDLAAKEKYAMKGGRVRTGQRAVGDVKGLRESLKTRLGVDDAALTDRAPHVYDDVRAQMKGIKHLEERLLTDNTGKSGPETSPTVESRTEQVKEKEAKQGEGIQASPLFRDESRDTEPPVFTSLKEIDQRVRKLSKPEMFSYFQASAADQGQKDAANRLREAYGRDPGSQETTASKADYTKAEIDFATRFFAEYGARNKFATKEAKDAALDVLTDKDKRHSGGPSVEELKALATVAAYHIEATSREFADFAKYLKNELGDAYDKYAPHIRAVWDEAIGGRNIDAGNAETLKTAKTGEPVTLTGYRFDRGEPLEGTGTFYGAHPSGIAQYSGVASKDYAAKIGEMKSEPVELKNPLVVDGDQKNAYNALAEALPKGDPLKSEMARAWQEVIDNAEDKGERGYDKMDVAIKKAADSLGYDGVVYRDKGSFQGTDAEVNHTEIVKFEQPHHSTTQPRTPEGQFDGPPTGIANATVEAERAAKGQDAIEKEARKGLGESYDAGKATVDADPAFRDTVSVWAKDKAQLSDEDVGALTYDRRRLLDEHKAVYEALEKAQADGGDQTSLLIARDRIEAAINDNDLAATHGGTQTARALNARKMMLAEDYSLSNQLQRARVANGGKELDAKTRERIETLIKERDDAVKALETVQAKAAERALARKTRQLQSDTAREVRQERRRGKSADLRVEFDDLSRAFLKAANKLSVNPLFEPELYKLIGKMARNRVKAGINTADGLVDAIHGAIAGKMPDLTRDDVRDAISGYGKPADMTKPQIVSEIARIRRQLRQEAKATANGRESDQTETAKAEATKRKSASTRLKNRESELQAKLDAGDYSVKERPQPILDPQVQVARERVARLEDQLNVGRKRLEHANRSGYAKILDFAAKWSRAVKLSGSATLAKLSAFTVGRQAVNIPEEMLGGIMSHTPGISQVAIRAPREGGFNTRAQVNALAEFLKAATYKDAWQTLKTGKSSLDVLYGKGHDLPPEALDFFGQIHSAMKTPAKRAEFARSIQKRAGFAARNGYDITDPTVQATIAAAAYKDANRSILMQDNRLSKEWTGMLGRIERTGPGGKTVATIGRILLPIIKIPSNFVFETSKYVAGSIHGTAMLLAKGGAKNLTPEQADYVMRAFKKQGVGAALMMLGYMSPGAVGGYYQRGEKREDEDVHAGDVRVFGVEIPHFLLHTPALEALQIGATLRRVIDKYSEGGKGGGVGEGVRSAGMGLAEQVPFVGETFRNARAADSTTGIGNRIGEVLKGSLVPPDVQKVAKGGLPFTEGKFGDLDADGKPIPRKPAGIVDTVKMAIPGLRQTVPVDEKKVDAALKDSIVKEGKQSGLEAAGRKFQAAVKRGDLAPNAASSLEKRITQTKLQQQFGRTRLVDLLPAYNALPKKKQSEVIETVIKRLNDANPDSLSTRQVDRIKALIPAFKANNAEAIKRVQEANQ